MLNFLRGFLCVLPSDGKSLQGRDVIFEAEAAGVDLCSVFRADIPPVPRFIGDLRLVFIAFGIPQDEAVICGMFAKPAESGSVLKSLVQTGMFRAVQVGGKAAVMLRVTAARPQLCSE